MSQSTKAGRLRPPINYEREVIVCEDIDLLKDLISRTSQPTTTITNKDLRQSSLALRRLLCENQLMQVANARDFVITVDMPETASLSRFLNNDKSCVYFQLGCFSIGTVSFSGLAINRGDTSNSKIPINPDATYSGNLETFKRQPSFSVEAKLAKKDDYVSIRIVRAIVARERVIDYVANKAGGVHFDPGRKRVEEELLDAVRCSSGATMSLSDVHVCMPNIKLLEDPFIRRARLPIGIASDGDGQFDPVMLELLGTASFLVKSESIAQLRMRLCKPVVR